MKKNNIQIKTLTKDDLARLAKGKINQGLSVSFYLGFRPEINFRSEANSVLAGGVKKVKESKKHSEAEKKKISAMADLIKREINLLRLPPKTRTIIFFLNDKSGLEIYRMPVYMPSVFIAKADFYIHPLIKSAEEFPRYLAVSVERDRAEFFSIFLGEIEGEPETIASDVPKKIRTSTSDDWKGRREKRIARHIENHLKNHFKAVAAKIEKCFSQDKFDYLIIGGHGEITAKFQEFLEKKSAEKLIGRFNSPHRDHNFIREKIVEIAAKHEKAVEEKIVGDLLNGINSKNEKWEAVAGADSVIKNIRRRNVSLLVIGRNYGEAGYACPICHFSSFYEEKCPACEIPTAKASDAAGKIIEEAIGNKIKIRQLLYGHKNFDRFGIGAFLRKY